VQLILGDLMSKFQLVKLPIVRQITTFSSATIYRLIKKGEFPKQIKLSERSSGWILEEIYSWLDQKKNSRDGDNL
jgi:prophage regulatory protein